VAAPSAAGVSDNWRQRLGQTLSCAGPWRVALGFSMYSSQWLAVIGFLPAIYASAGWQGPLVGLLTASACLSNVSGNVVAGRLLHRGVAPRRLLYVGFGAMALSTLFAFAEFTASAPVLRYLAVLIFSAVGGLIPATMFSLAVQVAPSERTVSTTVGWMQQCSSTGQFFGPPLVAWVAAQAGGWQWTWVLTGLTSLAGLWLARQLHFEAQRPA
jgi:MFS family permease